MLPLAEFVAAYDGKSVGCGANGGPGDFPTGQCTALACLWTVNLGLGQPCGYCSGLSRCDAICWAGVAAPGWTWIANALGNFPSPGDLVVFGAGCGYDVPAGHIAVVMPGANTSSIPVFEQNFNGPYCATNTHSYACCLGWQHPGVTLPGSSSRPRSRLRCPRPPAQCRSRPRARPATSRSAATATPPRRRSRTRSPPCSPSLASACSGSMPTSTSHLSGTTSTG